MISRSNLVFIFSCKIKKTSQMMFAYVMRLTLLKKTTQMGLAYAMRLVLFKENENISYHKRIGF